MKTLMILRHAKAQPHDEERDRERGLAASGREACARVGAFMNENALFPDFILVSDSARTRQTLDGIAPFLPKDIPIRHDRRLYLAESPALLSQLRAVEGRYDKVLLIGHSPGCEDLALGLLHSAETKLARKMKKKFPTAALAVLEISIPQWSDLAWGSAHLDLFVAPSDL